MMAERVASERCPAVADVTDSINGALRRQGGKYAGYSCKDVSWDDVCRGTSGGALSCWGANITDTRLRSKDGRPLYTLRSDNWDEKLGKVRSKDVAVLAGNETPGDEGALTPVTLHTFLSKLGEYGGYAGLPARAQMANLRLDDECTIRFQTTFLPVGATPDKGESIEFATDAYNYNTKRDDDPRNLVLLCTSQGVAVQQDGEGTKQLFHHAVDGDEKIHRYWLEAERSAHGVGGPQRETAQEREAAAQRGKATASVIGIKAMGTRFNTLMTIQVPLKQQEFDLELELVAGSTSRVLRMAAVMPTLCIRQVKQHVQERWAVPTDEMKVLHDRAELDEEKTLSDFGILRPCRLTVLAPEGILPPTGSAFNVFVKQLDGEVTRFFVDPETTVEKLKSQYEDETGVPPDQQRLIFDGKQLNDGRKLADYNLDVESTIYFVLRLRGGGDPPPEDHSAPAWAAGMCNAARVSRGSEHDVWDGLTVEDPARHPSEHVAITVVMYHTVAGGLPSTRDVVAAVDDLEALYAACSTPGCLAEQAFDFAKCELSAGHVEQIASKLATQPYTPPPRVVVGFDEFPVDD